MITNKSYVLGEGKILAYGSSRELADNPIVKKYYLGDHFKLWNLFAKKIKTLLLKIYSFKNDLNYYLFVIEC